jgi:hypothetical protein
MNRLLTREQYRNKKKNLKQKIKRKNKIQYNRLMYKIYNNIIENINYKKMKINIMYIN